MKYARIVDNVVWETFVPHSGATIEECFTPEIVAQFVECPEEVERSWTFENGVYVAPPVVEPAIEEVIIDAEVVEPTPAVE